VRLATPDESLGYKFVQEAVKELEDELSGDARPVCLEPGTLAVPEVAMPLPAPVEDAETVAKHRRLIDRKETAALRRSSLMWKVPKITRQRSRSPLREEESKEPPGQGEALPEDEALIPRDDGRGADPAGGDADSSERPFWQRQQFFDCGGVASNWQHPVADESPWRQRLLHTCYMSRWTTSCAHSRK